MKRFLLSTLAAGFLFSLSAEERLITLDLSNSTTPLLFNEDTGAWSDTYDDDASSIESQCFSFIHNSMSDWNTWWGFTASNSTDNSFHTNFVKYQFSNMAQGGIALNSDGIVMTDEFGAPVVTAEMPYLVGFYSPFMSPRPLDMTFNTGKSYEAVGVYVNLNSYSYYSVYQGDGFARAFTNGDRFTLTIHGVAPDGDQREVEVEMAASSNGNLTVNRGWRYVDLTSLGEINELYFTMKSTDSGAYGDNTAEYFCLDKLTVRETASSVEGISAGPSPISYDRASRKIILTGSDFAIIYDAAGRKVMSSSERVVDIKDLPAGVYVVRSGNRSLKIAK